MQQKPRPAESPLSASPLQPEPCLHRPPPTNSSPPSSPAATPLNRIQIISNRTFAILSVVRGVPAVSAVVQPAPSSGRARGLDALRRARRGRARTRFPPDLCLRAAQETSTTPC